MSELPIDLGKRKAMVLQEARPLFKRAGEKRHIARRVVERLAVCLAAIGNVDQQCSVACAAGRWHDENNFRGVGYAAVLIGGGLSNSRNDLLRRQIAMDPALPHHVVAGAKCAVWLLGSELDPGHFGVRGTSCSQQAKQGNYQDCTVRHWHPPKPGSYPT